MTCRNEVLNAMERLKRRHGKSVFPLTEIVQEVLSHTRQYEESTISTHISAHMCAQAPVNAAPLAPPTLKVPVQRVILL